MNGLAQWASLSRKRLLFDMYGTYVRERKIRNILNKEKIDMIYMGDMNNLSCKFGALLYARLGFKIGFYEEGISHYYWAQYSDKYPFVNLLLAKLTDYFSINLFGISLLENICSIRHSCLLRFTHE